jgi:hypothetical protein
LKFPAQYVEIRTETGQGRSFHHEGVFIVGDREFEEFMSEQIEEIRSFRQQLEEEEGREVGIDEAARRWIKQYAERYREAYKQEKAS